MLTGFDRAALPSAPNLVGRIWAKDDSLWPPGQDRPSDRLGWLHLPERMKAEVPGLMSWAGQAVDGIESVALMGMGGSSLAPELFAELFTHSGEAPRLLVMDSTHPDQIRRWDSQLDLNKTLFVVSSKSGGTVETLSLYRHYRALIDDGSRFVAITDRGSALSRLADEESFGRAFHNPPDVGGRYSALSLFGLAPAALVGADVAQVLARAAVAADKAVLPDPAINDGLALGLHVAGWFQSGADKMVMTTSDSLTRFADWTEQLLAESTGKQSKGIVPIVGDQGATSSSDRRVADLKLDRERTGTDDRAGDLTITMADIHDVGAHMLVWEFATAVVGALIEVNPFDQPDVEAAKRAARAALTGDLPRWPEEDPSDLFAGMAPPEYAALLAFAPATDEHREVLARARRFLGEAHGVVSAGAFGPRYLHSSGQLYKGGPDTIRALVILDSPSEDLPIPENSATFGDLMTAQAAGDAQAMRNAGKRVAMTSWDRFADWVVRSG